MRSPFRALCQEPLAAAQVGVWCRGKALGRGLGIWSSHSKPLPSPAPYCLFSLSHHSWEFCKTHLSQSSISQCILLPAHPERARAIVVPGTLAMTSRPAANQTLVASPHVSASLPCVSRCMYKGRSKACTIRGPLLKEATANLQMHN